jgi:hypothetical protein
MKALEDNIKITAIVSAWTPKYLEQRMENLYRAWGIDQIVIVYPRGDDQVKGIIEDIKSSPYEKYCVFSEQDDSLPLYEAWNIGMILSENNIVANANCDDAIYPKGYWNMAKEMLKTGADVVYGNCDVVDEDGDVIDSIDWGEPSWDRLLNKGCFVGPMPIWKKDIGLFDTDYKVAGDYEYWLRAMSKGKKLVHLNELVGAYMYREDSLERRMRARLIWENAKIKRLYKEITL